MSRSRQPGSTGPLLETLGVFALVALAQFVTGLLGTMTGLFVLAPPVSENPWTIVTSVYAHGGLFHLLSNSVALVLFGWPVARATTRLRFHTFFIVTGSLAGISQVWVTSVVGPGTAVLGASGAVFALLGYLLTGNRLSTSMAGVVDLPRWLVAVIFLCLAGAVTIATASPGVALIAHFTGFLLGLVAGRVRLLQPRGRQSTGATDFQ